MKRSASSDKGSCFLRRRDILVGPKTSSRIARELALLAILLIASIQSGAAAPRSSLPALGVVFGDIGTSLLYTLKTVLNLAGDKPDPSPAPRSERPDRHPWR